MTVTSGLTDNSGVDLPKLEQASLAVLAGSAFLDFSDMRQHLDVELNRPSHSTKTAKDFLHAFTLVCVEAWLAYQGLGQKKGLRENNDMRERGWYEKGTR